MFKPSDQGLSIEDPEVAGHLASTRLRGHDQHCATAGSSTRDPAATGKVEVVGGAK